ncbi:hypothetical protein L1987_01586 [Smallanthus sonchifolius]|uniref:Uncharacterized protein n=1 Tax=Smallanthus sonchifolius TaxID=185202 RepID=A0ACB9K5L9_9ASTR|nr:hypothetical protein L1987_01586 [Smallanthus sonchifolius]
MLGQVWNFIYVFEEDGVGIRDGIGCCGTEDDAARCARLFFGFKGFLGFGVGLNGFGLEGNGFDGCGFGAGFEGFGIDDSGGLSQLSNLFVSSLLVVAVGTLLHYTLV